MILIIILIIQSLFNRESRTYSKIFMEIQRATSKQYTQETERWKNILYWRTRFIINLIRHSGVGAKYAFIPIKQYTIQKQNHIFIDIMYDKVGNVNA